MQFVPPLAKMYLTQPFGVDWTGVGLYARLGLQAHNGIDLRAPMGTEVFAAMDGEAWIEVEAPLGKPMPGYNSGYGINLKIRNKDAGLEVINGHLQNTLVPNGTRVKAGQLVALSGSTGISSGPHLHFGTKRKRWLENGSGPYGVDENNGYFGAIDPMQFFSPDVFALPVDKRYDGHRFMPELDWYKASAFFWNEIQKLEGARRLMTTREKNAFVYGAWDFRTVMDPSMFQVWSEMTKPAAIKAGIIKKV